jgi:hypothetical protein
VFRGLIALLLAGCSNGDPKSCRIENYASLDVKGDSPVECGSFSLDADAGFNDAAMQGAHDCVLDAVANGKAFTLYYDVWDAYRHVRGGFTGAPQPSGKMSLRAYGYLGDSLGGSFDPRPVVTVESCKNVVDDAGCTPAAGKPCLTCQSPSSESTLCRY